MIKAAIVKYAMPGTGRVNLTTFRHASLPGGWKMSESEAYLREMGALDESNPQNPSVVVPNYFDTPSNCARTSRFYQVCCISECEALLGHLEKTLGSPHASPAQILAIVEQLPSSTVEVPRKLPASLVRRLEGVAAFHGGEAPLHGRLFRQWMHHAYPFECSYPALSPSAQKAAQAASAAKASSAAQQAPAATKRPGAMVRRQSNHELQAGQEAARRQAAENQRVTVAVDAQAELATEIVEEEPATPEDALPWSDDEELYIVCRAGSEALGVHRQIFFGGWRRALFLAIAVVVALMFVRTQLRRMSKEAKPMQERIA